MPNINYSLPPDLHRKLKVLAAKEGTTLKELVIRLLEKGTRNA